MCCTRTEYETGETPDVLKSTIGWIEKLLFRVLLCPEFSISDGTYSFFFLVIHLILYRWTQHKIRWTQEAKKISFIRGRKEKENRNIEFLVGISVCPVPIHFLFFSILSSHFIIQRISRNSSVGFFFSSQLCSNIRKSWESRNISTTYYTRRNADHSVGRDQQNRPIEWIRFGGARNSGVGWRYPINQRNSKLPVTNFINRIEKDWHQPLCRNWQQMRVLRINNGTWI